MVLWKVVVYETRSNYFLVEGIQKNLLFNSVMHTFMFKTVYSVKMRVSGVFIIVP